MRCSRSREPFTARLSDAREALQRDGRRRASSWRFARSARVAQLDLAGYTPRGLHMSSDSSDHGNSQKKKKRSRHKCTATALPPAEPSPTPQPAPWRSTQFQLVDGVNRYRAGQQEVDGTIMLYGAVGGHMCSFAQLTDYSRGLEVGRRKAPRERFACGAPARPWTRLHRCLRTVDRIAYRIANDQCCDHLSLHCLPADPVQRISVSLSSAH